MLYILHRPEEINDVEENIIPLLQGKVEYELFPFSELSELQPTEGDNILTYLHDSDLKKLLPIAGKNDWCVAILPHPEIVYTTKGLGISGDSEQVITELLETKEKQKLDLLYCNGTPVFQSVNIGNIFLLTDEENKKNFASQVLHFITNLREISSLSHRSFTLTSDEEKVIQTSALGIVVVEHPQSSVISKRLVPEGAINDGMFHVLIMAPENVFELLLFFFRSLLPKSGTIQQRPRFIGSLKTPNLKIIYPEEIDFTIDGEKVSGTEINLEVHNEALSLRQSSIYCSEENKREQKRSMKIEGLPTGSKREQLSRRTLPWSPRATTDEFQDLFMVLREKSTATSSFVVMMILSTLIATFGLFANSSPVIIGAMILAPIISPIVSFSMGMVRYDTNMLKQGIITILIGTGVSLLFAAGVSLVVPLKILTAEINDRLSPTLLDMGIAVASGIAAAYAHAKEGIAKSLAGVAIAVALVPPLSVAGIGIGWLNWEVFSGAFLLYLTNLSGIIMFAGITFLFLGFAPFKRAKMGLVYTFIIIVLVMVPLSLSFDRIREEANITRKLEGANFEEVVLRDVKVRYGSPFMVSVKIVGPKALSSEEMEKIKMKIEERIGHSVTLEVISALEF